MNFLHRSPSARHGRRAVAVLALAAQAAAFAQVANVDVDKEMQEQTRLMAAKPEGPADQPWLQRLGGKTVDTTKYKKKGPYTLCFSNASVGNPWRVVGWNTMQAEVELNKADIKGFEYADAQGKDEKQIADIRSPVSYTHLRAHET